VDTPPGAIEREITLYGRQDQIDECRSRIKTLLGGRLEAMQAQLQGLPPPQGGSGGDRDRGAPGSGVIVMRVPNAQVGIVIGRG
jgi:hypothetical protein